MAHPLEHQDLILNLIPDCTGKSILDVGCGKGNWGYLIRSLRNGDKAHMAGIDLSEDYLNFCRRHNVYDELIKGDVRNLPFENRSFDLVLACEVVEHLPKEDGWIMLKELERVARGRIIITTPNGSMRQEAISEVETEEHLSGWHTPDFKRLGYKVRGFGFRLVRPTKIPFVYGFLDNVFTPFSYILPWLGGFLIAHKDMEHHQRSIGGDYR